MIGYDPTNSDLKSVIQCASGSLGFAFINVTALKIAKLMFSFCGAEFPSNFTFNERFVYPQDFKTKLSTTQVSKGTLYFLQTINAAISEVVITNSTGTGLLGINMFRLSTISQTIFSGNKPNCLLIFLDIPTTLQTIVPTVFNLVDLQITSESMQMEEYFRHQYATGLSTKLAQTTYKVRIYINNITNANTGIQSGRRSHLYITIENWMCHCSVVQAKQITTFNTPGLHDVLRIRWYTCLTIIDSKMPEHFWTSLSKQLLWLHMNRLSLTLKSLAESLAFISDIYAWALPEHCLKPAASSLPLIVGL